MLRRFALPVVALTAVAQLMTASATAVPAAAAATHEIVTWGASADRMGVAASDRSYRLVVRTSAGGTQLRVRLSNAFGDRPLTFGVRTRVCRRRAPPWSGAATGP